MTDSGVDSKLFEALLRELLDQGLSVRFQARGASMSPAIRDGEMVVVTPVIIGKLRKDDIVLTKSKDGFRVHRLVIADDVTNTFVTRGDCGLENDPAVSREQILGLATAKEVQIGRRAVCAPFKGTHGRVLRAAARGQYLAAKFLARLAHKSGFAFSRKLGSQRARTTLTAFALMFILLALPQLRAQVAVDSTTTVAGEAAGSGTITGTFNHTTSTSANRLLLVSVSLNINNSANSKVTTITYNGTALTLLGAHNDTGNTRRVEMWSLINPASGANLPVVLSVNIPTNNTIGVAAGATTFTGVDQTVPLGTFTSADGAAGNNSQLDVSSVINGMIFDTLAIGGNRTITVPSPQVQQWNLNTGFSGNTDVTGSASTRSGAPSVPISETFSNTSNWSLGAISINPTTADIGVSTSVTSAVFTGQNTTYNITVNNKGPSAANSVVLTDTLASGLTIVSITPSSGTSCSGTTTITCTLPTPLASGATATVAVVVTASASGAYPNTATVNDSNTPPDPNTGNNTYVSVAAVQSAVCATTSQAVAGGTLNAVVNTYYPGTASVAAGAKSIPVGTATGVGTAIAAGNLLLVIQMQDASINDSNSIAYGNGSTGAGFSTLNSAGNYEFVTATSVVSGGSISISGAGTGGGTVFAYNAAAATSTKGVSTYQVVLVPQYITATLAAGLTANAWNGSTGGVLVLDASSTLSLGGVTVSVDGKGFRGGAGLQLSGGVGGAVTDYLHAAPATYANALVNGVDAPKGEGIAGTPLWLESGGTVVNGNSSYPSGSTADGSNARGAPGNAGGGGTDGDPTSNDQNAGGGGGSNGGTGGFGGDSWSSNLSVGGEGGAIFPSTINRVAMGGGGGAGTRNNSDGDTQASGGAPGGGIIIIRANALSGTATLTANGAAAYNATSNDAGGGGGAGGSIVVLSASGGESGLTLQANGGRGGDAWDTQPYSLGDRHGPGGGGGGGVMLVSGAPASISVSGGASGATLNPGVAYGATAGAVGFSKTNAIITQTSGTQSGSQCTPDMTLGKSHVGNFTRGLNASYTIPVSNLSPYGPSGGTVTINDTLPTGLTPISATGTGWTCSISGQTVSCVRSDALAASSSYPSITLTASVAQTAPATVTNTAVVAGGGEINLANDTATDVATVVSNSDLSVTDSASPNPVAAGSNITYTQVVTNNGPSAADNATLVATVPANTTFVSLAAPAGWNCTTPAVGGTGNIVCTDLNMASATSAAFMLVAKVNTGTANGTVITENDAVSSSSSDPVTTNNMASASVVVGTTTLAEMTVTNSASPDPVIAGSNITYTQTATNIGSVTANGVTLTENTPANTTFQSITVPTGVTCATPAVGGTGTITCTYPTAPVGSSGTLQLVVQVAPGTVSGTVINDTVTVNATNQAFGANSATATDIVATSTQADLALSTVATPSSVFSGNDITYTQTVTNNGPAAAAAATFTEAIPSGTTFVSVSAPVGWTCTTTTSVVCADPSLAAGSSADIIVVVGVPSGTAAGTITANSSVSSTTSDPTTTNNSTTVTTPITVACDLVVTNTGSPNPVAAGGNITYTQAITNNGPSNCSTSTLSEATPANTTFVSASVTTTGGGTWTCPNSAPVSCTNPSVPPGSTGTLITVYKVPTGTASGTVITDTATVATTSHDTNLLNNTATSTIGVASTTQADLSVTNSASPNPVTAGGNITYTQTLTNAGPAAASTVSFTETLPANTTAQSLTGPAGWTCTLATLTCTNSTLAAGGTASFNFVAKVNTNVASGTTITQTDSVSSATSDPNTTNNSAAASVVVGDSADLSVTNSASPVPVQAGNNITYTQVVTNAGPSTATTATFTEVTPPSTTFQSITPPTGWSCTTPAVGSTGTITCTDPSFAPGSANFAVAVKVNAGTAAGTAINDTATVSSSTTDPNAANNTATANDVVAAAMQADLVVTNIASPTSVNAGSNVTYAQSVTNDGPAAATSTTFTEATPPNTTFQSITPPTGWTCVTPAVGSTGTITCTDGSNLAVSATANFALALQVNAGTPSGTSIADTVTANASNIVPSLTSNSATATVVVANANSADVSIVKTATPNPVSSGDPLTYSLAVVNNGPASATNVTVTDALPSAVTYPSAITTQGTCSEAGGTVTCQLGTMANAATATITILTIAETQGMATNTATVVADQIDSNTANNTSSQIETITAPTSIKLQSFSAHRGTDKNGANRIVLIWKTGGEVHNLGFNVYREQDGNRVRLNSSLIAGSALMMHGALPQHAGKTYSWIDPSTGALTSSYWLEDVDVNGTRTMHGPVSADSNATTQPESDSAVTTATMFSQISQAQPSSPSSEMSHVVENVPQLSAPTTNRIQKQFDLASHSAVKIQIRHEGWYQIAQSDLVNAGLDPNVDPAHLHFYAEANEQPLQINGASTGPGGFGAQASISFYGTGINTVYSGTRVYWLVVEDSPGMRIQTMQPSSGSNQPPTNFLSTVELQQHTTYFSALLTPNGDNFFGALISPTPVEQLLHLPHLDQTSTTPARIEVVLQGVITGIPHDVTVVLNGTALGHVTFTGQDEGRLSMNVPASLLLDWDNTVTLTAQNGPYDINLVDYIRITYPHAFVADSDELKFTGRPGDEIKVIGFDSAPAEVLDITDPDHPVQVAQQVSTSSSNGNYELKVQIPWTTTSLSAPARHTLLAVALDRVASAAGVKANHPSHWHGAQAGADIAMITDENFAAALAPLVKSHQAAGKSSAVIAINDLYDEFNFGERSPFVIRQLLQSANSNWKTPPTYLLLNGRASLDPRNYLGFGHLDLVPTKIVPTTSLMTASDDWFSDFTDSGMPTIATGRLPVSTIDDATTVIGKIVAYEGKSTNGPWTGQALIVADRDDTEDFAQDSESIQAQLPSALQVTDVFDSEVGTTTAQQEIVTAINSGQLLVNYLGHGSEDQWSGGDIFDNTTVTTLTNGTQLPVFLIMDCLNGFFQDVYSEPLSVTLMLAPNGGGVAVLASSGLNQAAPQVKLDKLIVENALNAARPTLGESILKAKAKIGDPAVRRTYILLGDPAMQIKQPVANATTH